MPNITQNKLDEMIHAAWIKGAACALAHVADEQRFPTIAAYALQHVMQPSALSLAEPYDRKRLEGAAANAWQRSLLSATPQRIQLSRRKGFNLQRASLALNSLPAVNVSRPFKWGNPFRLHGAPKTKLNHQLLVDQFAAMLKAGQTPPFNLAEIRIELRGKNLACWCKPGMPCHADILLQIANA
jgi:hypothetical protein